MENNLIFISNHKERKWSNYNNHLGINKESGKKN